MFDRLVFDKQERDKNLFYIYKNKTKQDPMTIMTQFTFES